MEELATGFVEKIRGFLLSPTETFRKTRPDTLGDGLEYAVIWYAILGILIIARWIPSFPIKIADLDLALIPLFFVMMIVFGVIALIIGGAWQHLWVYVCGGRKGYTQTVKALAYGLTPSYVLGWIPFYKHHCNHLGHCVRNPRIKGITRDIHGQSSSSWAPSRADTNRDYCLRNHALLSRCLRLNFFSSFKKKD